MCNPTLMNKLGHMIDLFKIVIWLYLLLSCAKMSFLNLKSVYMLQLYFLHTYIHTYMSPHIQVHMCIYTHTGTYTFTHTYVKAHTYILTYTHACIHTRICALTRIRIHTRPQIQTHMLTCTHIYVHVHTHMYTHTYANTHAHVLNHICMHTHTFILAHIYTPSHALSPYAHMYIFPHSCVYHHHHHHHHHHVLTLSRHYSLSFIASDWSSGLHSVSSQSCGMYVRAGRPDFARSYAGVHWSTSLMSTSLLLQQCPACLGPSNLDSFRDGRQVAV